MEISWSDEKNKLLKKTRNVSFEQIFVEIQKGNFIGPEINPTNSMQQRIIVLINNYPYIVPFVINKNGDWFLKTIFPSRKMKERLKI